MIILMKIFFLLSIAYKVEPALLRLCVTVKDLKAM